MAKGGKRTGAGRKPGSKDGTPRKKKKDISTIPNKEEGKKLEEYDDSTKPLYFHIEEYLGVKHRKIYKKLMPRFDTPLDCLKALRDDLMVRYNFARIAEMEGVSTAKRIAKDSLEELEQKGTLNKKVLPSEEKKEAIKKLKAQLKTHYPQLSSQVTSLATELRQICELIDRIESNRQDLTLNIFNILGGRGDKKKLDQLRDKIFSLPPEAKDVHDADFTEVTQDE